MLVSIVLCLKCWGWSTWQIYILGIRAFLPYLLFQQWLPNLLWTIMPCLLLSSIVSEAMSP